MSEHPLLRAMAENEAYERAKRRYLQGKGKNTLGQYIAAVDADVELARFRGEVR